MQRASLILLSIAGVLLTVAVWIQVVSPKPVKIEYQRSEPKIVIIQKGEVETYYNGVQFYVDYMVDLEPHTQSFCSAEVRDLFIDMLKQVGEVSELWK